MVWKVQRKAPVRTSNARISPRGRRMSLGARTADDDQILVYAARRRQVDRLFFVRFAQSLT